MEILVEGHNIVLVGGWNRHIFTPQWVASSLADGADPSFQLALDDPRLTFRISFGDSVLIVSSDRLQLHSTIVGDNSLAASTDLALRLLTMLPHTPVSALGVNFAWRELDPPQDLLTLFTFSDTADLADARRAAAATAIKRTFPWDAGNLNFTISLNSDAHLLAEFNFHWAVTSATEAEQHLSQRVPRTRAVAHTLLRTVYDLEEDS